MKENNIPIYAAEADIADLIRKSNVVVSDCIVIKTDKDIKDVPVESIPNLVNSNLGTNIIDNKYVTPISSILVSSLINKNDDCFSSNELIKAYETPRYKPINWQHNGNEVRGNETIGVMIDTSLWSGALDDLKAVDTAEASVDDVTGQTHIRQDGIIWSSYFPTYSENIREGIEDDKLFVSMECFYDDFGYVIELGGEAQLVHRDEDNAKASEHLKCYGGTGKITIKGKEFRIARWLKDIEFSGQGIVNSPANVKDGKPLSIIFSAHKKKKNKKNNSNYAKMIWDGDCFDLELNSLSNRGAIVYNELANIDNKGNKDMDNADRIKELEAKLTLTEAERDSYIKKVATLESSELQAKIDELTEAAKKSKEEFMKMLEEKKKDKAKADQFDELQAKFDVLEKEKSELAAELEGVKALEVARSRESELKEIASDKIEIPYNLESLTDMSDETFEAVKSMLKAGVSGLAKSTDQTVSGKPKSTDQTVSGKPKSTEASDKDDVDLAKDATDALDDTKVDDKDADLVLSGSATEAQEKTERRKTAARVLLSRAIPAK